MTDTDVYKTFTDHQNEIFAECLGLVYDYETEKAAVLYKSIEPELNEEQKLAFQYGMARMEKLRARVKK